MSLISKQIDELRAYAKDRNGELANLIADAADTIERLSAKLSAYMTPVDLFTDLTDEEKKASREYAQGYTDALKDTSQKWISTKVKPDPDLPEDDMSGYFLVTLHTYGNIGFDMDKYEVKKMRWNRVNGWVLPVHSPAWIEEALTQDVLAWKPCPEPYREDGAE